MNKASFCLGLLVGLIFAGLYGEWTALISAQMVRRACADRIGEIADQIGGLVP